MIPVISKSQAYDLDIASVSSGIVLENTLIRNAATSIYKYCKIHIKSIKSKKFLFVAGKGNNGKDGIEAHKIFKKNNIFSNLFLMEDLFQDIDKLEIDLEDIIANSNPDFDSYDVIIDGLLGIGLKGELKADYYNMIEKINDSKKLTISVDLPSGIKADTGLDAGTSVIADHTITMGYPKKGLYFNKGKVSSGSISISDIGYPEKIKNFTSKIFLIQKKDVSGYIKSISKNADKFSRGRLGTLVGSKKYPGAAILSIRSSLEAGAGIVESMIPESIRSIIDSNIIESISISFDDKNTGYISKKSDLIYGKKLIKKYDCVLIGSGLDEDLRSIKFASNIIKSSRKKIVIDGSGLLSLSNNHLTIEELPTNTIMTPHYYEFSKIFGIDVELVKYNPIDVVSSIIPQLGGRVLILKGPTTIIVNSKGEILLLDNGSEILSTAGTGDVLAGIVSSLSSQGYSIDSASIIGTWIHGDCSRKYILQNGMYGLTASKLIDYISVSLNSL